MCIPEKQSFDAKLKIQSNNNNKTATTFNFTYRMHTIVPMVDDGKLCQSRKTTITKERTKKMDHIERKSKILYGYDEMTIITEFNAITVVEKLLMQTVDRVKISFTIETL